VDTNASQQLTSSWERLKVASTVLGTVLIPLVIVFVSSEYTSAIKQNEIGQRYVELAVGILSKPPTESTMHTRAWAVDVVNQYSGVEMRDKARQELITGQLEVLNSTVKSANEVIKLLNEIQ
jgi:hypothetical protein